MRSWFWFRDTIRKVTVGAALVAELLDSVLMDDEKIINDILSENCNHRTKLGKLVKCAQKTAKTIRGRIELKRLSEQYRTEAHWPTDDITLRKAYEIYKSGRLATCLPAVDKLVSRLA